MWKGGVADLKGESNDERSLPLLPEIPDGLPLRLQDIGILAEIAVERGDLEVALEIQQRALRTAREDYTTDAQRVEHLSPFLKATAKILGSLGRLGEALTLDVEWLTINPGKQNEYPELFVRMATHHMRVGQDAEAEDILRNLLRCIPREWHESHTRKRVEDFVKPHILMAELLERRGTEEALAEARRLRDGAAQQLATHEVRRIAALEETRAAAAEAVRQWREERSKARGEKKGDKGKGKKKSKKARARRRASPRARKRRLLRQSRGARRASQPGRRRGGQQPWRGLQLQRLSSRLRASHSHVTMRRRRRRRRGRSARSVCKTWSSRTTRIRGARREERGRRLWC
jgi:tetratricopeptide (TPR) repeat protein